MRGKQKEIAENSERNGNEAIAKKPVEKERAFEARQTSIPECQNWYNVRFVTRLFVRNNG